jgi:gliding motility-associated-like protein
MVILFLFPKVLLAGNPAVNTDCAPTITIAENKNNVCLNTSITIHATVGNEGTNGVYKWKRNYTDVGANGADYTAADFEEGDVVTCEYSCTTTCGTDTLVGSSEDTIHIINDIKPVIAVANTDSIICEGELTVFTTQAFYGSAIPSYQWKLNDELINDTTPSYPTDTLTNGSKVECVLTISTPGCSGTRSSTSWMTIYVYPMIHPAIKITPSRTDICRGEEVTFTATANGGAYPSFAWEINGNPTGQSSPELIMDSLKDGDTISCTVTIDEDSRCHTGISAASNKVVIHVKDYIDPTLTISAPFLDVCVGTPLTFIATPKNAGDYTLYQWNVNDHSIGEVSSTFITDQLKNDDKVSCLLSTNVPGCSLTASVSSNYEIVTIRDTPVITFSPPDTSIQSGESARLSATVAGDIASFIWEPDNLLVTPQSLTSFTIPLGETTVFNLKTTDTHGCKATGDVKVKVLYKMHIPSAFTPNKDGKNDIFRVPAGSSVTLEQFSVYDRWGHIIFRTADISKGWDGTYKGLDMPAGTYVYLIKGTLGDNAVIEKGTITLIR